MPVSPTCYFGKLPIQGDFIRLNNHVPELGQLDQWIQEGIYQSREARGRDWVAEFDAVGTTRFIYHSSASQGLLVGICRASSDSSGRRYPFLLAARSPALPRAEFGHLPVELAAFHDQADALANRGWQDGDLSKFQERSSRILWQHDPATASSEFQSQLEAKDTESFWNEILPGSTPARRALFLSELHQVLGQAQAPRFVLRMPAGNSPATVAFLLTIVTAWSAEGRLPNLSMWHDKGTLDRSALCLLFDELAGRYFEPLLWPLRPSDHAYELAHDRPATEKQQQVADAKFGPAAASTGKLSELLFTLQKAGS